MTVRTFADAGPLIAAAHGSPGIGEIALRVLADPRRVFLSSPFLHAEVVPHAVRQRSRHELAAYAAYFGRVEWATDLDAILRVAREELARVPLGLADALHLAAAHLLRADEFVTTESPRKDVYRITLVRVVRLVA